MIKYDKKDTLGIFQTSFINLCNKKPFNKISMREVARNSGLSHTLLMRYYPTKKDLLLDSFKNKMLERESSFLRCNSTFEIASVLLEMWEYEQDLVFNFSIAFSDESKINKEVYKTSRSIIMPHLERVVPKGGDLEVEYTLLCSLSYYPSTVIKTGESLANIKDYISRIKSIREIK